MRPSKTVEKQNHETAAAGRSIGIGDAPAVTVINRPDTNEKKWKNFILAKMCRDTHTDTHTHYLNREWVDELTRITTPLVVVVDNNSRHWFTTPVLLKWKVILSKNNKKLGESAPKH